MLYTGAIEKGQVFETNKFPGKLYILIVEADNKVEWSTIQLTDGKKYIFSLNDVGNLVDKKVDHASVDYFTEHDGTFHEVRWTGEVTSPDSAPFWQERKIISVEPKIDITGAIDISSGHL